MCDFVSSALWPKISPVWADTKNERDKIRGSPFLRFALYTGACTLEKIDSLPMFSRTSGLARAMVFLSLWVSGLSLPVLIFFLCFSLRFSTNNYKLGARVHLSHVRLPTVRPGSCHSCSGLGADRRASFRTRPTNRRVRSRVTGILNS